MLSRRDSRVLLGGIAVALVAAAGLIGFEYVYEQGDLRDRAEAITGGDAARGKQLLSSYGCGGCHNIPGVAQAQGMVGPPLDTIGARGFIAGRLENTPANMERWIENPQEMSPGTAMPNLGVGHRDARDMTAYLYTRS
ncbi:cytochrome C [Sphingobium sp. SCG-1]|uniref:c-type cytochrome n=1 Tax=Sphingobium sp. SCG-1 TaxID=2072936 RepID=UPI000CD6A61A|nr:c-type cytochrome [Sphingobium sp. SCG-1]AUW57042.1 cytochrome C [Sphingobium sp. SCG-1]